MYFKVTSRTVVFEPKNNCLWPYRKICSKLEGLLNIGSQYRMHTAEKITPVFIITQGC